MIDFRKLRVGNVVILEDNTVCTVENLSGLRFLKEHDPVKEAERTLVLKDFDASYGFHSMQPHKSMVAVYDAKGDVENYQNYPKLYEKEDIKMKKVNKVATKETSKLEAVVAELQALSENPKIKDATKDIINYALNKHFKGKVTLKELQSTLTSAKKDLPKETVKKEAKKEVKKVEKKTSKEPKAKVAIKTTKEAKTAKTAPKVKQSKTFMFDNIELLEVKVPYKKLLTKWVEEGYLLLGDYTDIEMADDFYLEDNKNLLLPCFSSEQTQEFVCSAYVNDYIDFIEDEEAYKTLKTVNEVPFKVVKVVKIHERK